MWRKVSVEQVSTMLQISGLCSWSKAQCDLIAKGLEDMEVASDMPMYVDHKWISQEIKCMTLPEVIDYLKLTDEDELDFQSVVGLIERHSYVLGDDGTNIAFHNFVLHK